MIYLCAQGCCHGFQPTLNLLSVLYVPLDTVKFNYMQRKREEERGMQGELLLFLFTNQLLLDSVCSNIGKAIGAAFYTNFYESFQQIAP